MRSSAPAKSDSCRYRYAARTCAAWPKSLSANSQFSSARRNSWSVTASTGGDDSPGHLGQARRCFRDPSLHTPAGLDARNVDLFARTRHELLRLVDWYQCTMVHDECQAPAIGKIQLPGTRLVDFPSFRRDSYPPRSLNFRELRPYWLQRNRIHARIWRDLISLYRRLNMIGL